MESNTGHQLSLHTHQWMLDYDEGQLLIKGVCKCGAERDFHGRKWYYDKWDNDRLRYARIGQAKLKETRQLTNSNIK